MNKIRNELTYLTNEQLIEIASEIDSSFIEDNALIRFIAAKCYDCKMEDTDNNMFIFIWMNCSIVLAKRLHEYMNIK
jgi:hypothetical protein